MTTGAAGVGAAGVGGGATTVTAAATSSTPTTSYATTFRVAASFTGAAAMPTFAAGAIGGIIAAAAVCAL